MLLSLFGSMILFGTGELIVLKDKIYIFAEDDVLWRFFLAYGYATLSMTTVFSLAFFFSSLVENAVGPIITTMAVIIIFIIISALPIDALNSIKPFLFTNHMSEWRNFFGDPLNFSSIVNSGLVLLGHIIFFYGLTLYLFKKKDILN